MCVCVCVCVCVCAYMCVEISLKLLQHYAEVSEAYQARGTTFPFIRSAYKIEMQRVKCMHQIQRAQSDEEKNKGANRPNISRGVINSQSELGSNSNRWREQIITAQLE